MRDRWEDFQTRIGEMAAALLHLDAEVFPFFVFKNSDADDGVENWFSRYDSEREECVPAPLSECESAETEFVIIDGERITGFIPNGDFNFSLSAESLVRENSQEKREGQPKRSKVVAYDTFAFTCQFFTNAIDNDGCCCTHPEQENDEDEGVTGRGECHSWNCPFGSKLTEEDWGLPISTLTGWILMTLQIRTATGLMGSISSSASSRTPATSKSRRCTITSGI
jgi:hypothetical protein